MHWLLGFAKFFIQAFVNRIKDDDDLDDGIVEIAIIILEKCVKMTKTNIDDNILQIVKNSLSVKRTEISSENEKDIVLVEK